MVDEEFLELSLAHNTREHDDSCLCKECRARDYFDLALENSELQRILLKSIGKLENAISACLINGELVPEGVMDAVFSLISELNDTKMSHPEFYLRGKRLVVDLTRAQIRSLMLEEEIAKEVEDHERAYDYRFSSYHKNQYGDWQDITVLAGELDKKLGLNSRPGFVPIGVGDCSRGKSEAGGNRVESLKKILAEA